MKIRRVLQNALLVRHKVFVGLGVREMVWVNVTEVFCEDFFAAFGDWEWVGALTRGI